MAEEIPKQEGNLEEKVATQENLISPLCLTEKDRIYLKKVGTELLTKGIIFLFGFDSIFPNGERDGRKLCREIGVSYGPTFTNGLWERAIYIRALGEEREFIKVNFKKEILDCIDNLIISEDKLKFKYKGRRIIIDYHRIDEYDIQFAKHLGKLATEGKLNFDPEKKLESLSEY